jgi:hypothetical protein
MFRLCAISLVLLCTGATCVSQRLSRFPYYMAKDRAGQPTPKRWLVASMNLDLELPQNLVSPAETLHTELLDYLKESGCEASAVPFSELRQRLTQLLAAAPAPVAGDSIGGGAERERALGMLALDLADEREFDVMLVPNLVIREAQFTALSAIWDGVSRRHPVSGRMGKIDKGSLSGNTDALSLHVRVWSKSGEKVFESFGGLDILNRIVIQDYQFQMVQRDDLLQDTQMLREGIAISLDPLIPERSD